METLYDKIQKIDTRGKSIFQLCKEINSALSPMDRIPVHKASDSANKTRK